MLRIKFVICLFMACCMGSVFAGTPQTDNELAGNWTHDSFDGVFTQLEIEDSGKFVFRQQHSNDLRRAYMCGNLTDEGDVLRLRVQNHKERLVNGEIVQASGVQEKSFTVKSRSARRLVVTVGTQTVVLNLT